MKKRISVLFVIFLLSTFSLSMGVFAATNYKKAYRKVVHRFEQKCKGEDYDKCLYNLIYIDKDKKPELICVAIKLMPDGKNTWYSYSEYYTFYSGKERNFHEGWSNPLSVHHSLPFYKPKKNKYGFRVWDQGNISDVYWSINKGKGSIIKTESYGRIGDINNPSLNSKHKWIEGKYSKNKVLKKLK